MAKQPIFRLESLLSLKSRLVEAQEAELSILLAEERAAQSRLQAIEKARRDRQDALRAQSQGNLNCGHLSHYWAVMDGLDRAVLAQSRLVADIGARVNAKRAELVRLVQEKKALEKLKEKAVHEWEMELSRAEARLVDDLSIAQFARKQAEQRSSQEAGQ